MAATNRTPLIRLPLFVADDKPSWLGDVNNAHNLIDAAFVTKANEVASANATILSLQNAVAALTARMTIQEARP